MAEHVYKKKEACINTLAGFMLAVCQFCFAFSSEGNN